MTFAPICFFVLVTCTEDGYAVCGLLVKHPRSILESLLLNNFLLLHCVFVRCFRAFVFSFGLITRKTVSSSTLITAH